jgi:SRSO17 transposase
MSEDRQERFAAYVKALAGVIGHADRAEPLRDYCRGLLLPSERKSVEPIAAITAPARVSAKHQSLLHFVANAPWSNERVLGRIQELTVPIIEERGAIEAWIIDDTGFPKKGRHSVGVARQYCGELGKRDNCQIAVSLSLANHAASLPIAWRLYLPLEWTADTERRTAAGIPETVGFLTKPEIALEQIRAACAAGLPRGVVLMDAGYGTNTRLREEIGALGLSYVAGIPPQTSVWPPGTAPLPPLPWSGRGRRPKLTRRDAEHHPVSVKALALDLPQACWQTISWREGAAGALTSRFARVRVSPPRRGADRAARRGMAADRMARGRCRARQVLACHRPTGHALRSPGRSGEIALADRARLPGAETGTGPWTLRGARLARLPSSRHAVHRGLCLPDRRAGQASPLSRRRRRRSIRDA